MFVDLYAYRVFPLYMLLLLLIDFDGVTFFSVSRANRTAYSIIAREQAPSGASEDMFIPEDASSTVGT